MSWILLFALASGCGTSIETVTAAYIGCRPDQIQISEHSWGTWVATCHGRRFRCADSGESMSCAPEDGQRTVAAAAPAPRAPRSPSQTLRRTEQTDEAGTFALLSSRIHVSDYDFTFFAAPARERERLWLHVRGLALVVAPACELGLFIDGALVPLEPAAYQLIGSSAEYRIPVSLETLRQMASASSVSGRVCNREWRLRADEQTALREFVARIDEELVWLQRNAPTSGGEATP
jgi:hypothetical protein